VDSGANGGRAGAERADRQQAVRLAGRVVLLMRWRQTRVLLLVVLAPSGGRALDNGLGLTPPLGWRSYNAFGGRPTQAIMEAMMEAMVDRSRTLGGKQTSLLDLGYIHVGLDGGWNDCFAGNHSFHWASDGTPVWNSAFPDPKGMVDKAHALKLSPGWYLNNCGCAENHFEGAIVDKIMRGSVKMAADQVPILLHPSPPSYSRPWVPQSTPGSLQRP
jgi:hypothetical protein